MVILEVPACWLLFQPRCCFFLSKKRGMKLMWILDLMEFIICIATLVLLQVWWNYLAQFSVFLTFNLLSVFIRLVGSITGIYTQPQIAYYTRVISLTITVSLLAAQTCLTYLLTQQEYIYNDLNMGLCSFCANLDNCTQSFNQQFELNLSGVSQYSTVEEYAHRGISGLHCFYVSASIPFLFTSYILVQCHFIKICRDSIAHTPTIVVQDQLQVVLAANRALMSAGLDYRDTGLQLNINHRQDLSTDDEATNRQFAENWISQRTRLFVRDEETDNLKPHYSQVGPGTPQRNIHNCCVCLEAIKTNQRVIELRCQHLYHEDCGRQWILKNVTCPQCRKKAFNTSEKKRHRERRNQGLIVRPDSQL